HWLAVNGIYRIDVLYGSVAHQDAFVERKTRQRRDVGLEPDDDRHVLHLDQRFHRRSRICRNGRLARLFGSSSAGRRPWNVYATVINRRVKKLYVSLWYFLGSLFWFPLVYIIGQRTFVALPGLNDAIVGWFYGHNILGMWFTIVGVGMMYYLIPRITGNTLYSHGLSMLGFWGIALFYAPTGTHHILQSPVPEWL